MILFEITLSEEDPIYQEMAIANVNRQYDFLKSIVVAALGIKQPFLSSGIIKSLNFQAIAALHPYAGEFRPCPVIVGEYTPPDHYRVPTLMDQFINHVNFIFNEADPILLSAYVLWRLNHIHPFINGDGRTSRAVCYYILCMKSGGWIEGDTILPQLLDRDHDDYVVAIRAADASLDSGNLDLQPLHALISKLMAEQVAIVTPAANTP